MVLPILLLTLTILILVDLDLLRVCDEEVNILFYSDCLAIEQDAHLIEDEKSVKESNHSDKCRHHGANAKKLAHSCTLAANWRYQYGP